MDDNIIIHFDATTRRREKMQQAARGESSIAPSAPAATAAAPSPVEQPCAAAPAAIDAALSANVETTAVDAQRPASEPQPTVASAELESFLINFVVEQTGYPAEIVELDVDLEADLGIDSIKKAQMFGELREHFEFDVQSSGELSLDDFPTLRHIMAFLQAATESAAAPLPNEPVTECCAGDCTMDEDLATHTSANAEVAPVAEISDTEHTVDEPAAMDDEDLESFLVNFVVEQTGYPPELVELDADLEADLGIDSIKKAQMFGELREVFSFEVDDSGSLSLSDFPTLRHILQFLNDHAGATQTGATQTGTTQAVDSSATPPPSHHDSGPQQQAAEAPRPSAEGGLAWSGSPLAMDSSIVDSLRRILIDQGIANAARVNLTRKTRLMDDVGLDSIGMLDLIQAVEKEFGISISLDDLDLKGLNSTATFTSLIQRKLAGLA